jgi:hypothetical protein
MAKTIADLTALSQDVRAVQTLQAQIRQPMKDVLDDLVRVAAEFSRADNDHWKWLRSSRFSELLNTGSIGYGKYNFWVSNGDKFILETEGTYGGYGQLSMSIAEVSDLKTVLEQEFATK